MAKLRLIPLKANPKRKKKRGRIRAWLGGKKKPRARAKRKRGKSKGRYIVEVIETRALGGLFGLKFKYYKQGRYVSSPRQAAHYTLQEAKRIQKRLLKDATKKVYAVRLLPV